MAGFWSHALRRDQPAEVRERGFEVLRKMRESEKNRRDYHSGRADSNPDVGTPPGCPGDAVQADMFGEE